MVLYLLTSADISLWVSLSRSLMPSIDCLGALPCIFTKKHRSNNLISIVFLLSVSWSQREFRRSKVFELIARTHQYFSDLRLHVMMLLNSGQEKLDNRQRNRFDRHTFRSFSSGQNAHLERECSETIRLQTNCELYSNTSSDHF